MFRWYQRAEICYAFLEDVESQYPSKEECCVAIAKSRWFTRGFTLQELIAPVEVVFYSRHWRWLGTRTILAGEISRFTRIDTDVLLRGVRSLPNQSIAKRMSWAAYRQTTRPEDIAYCLLGIFDVQMPLLYGEGGPKAFVRLQEEIIRNDEDQSILAWTPRPINGDKNVIASRPGLAMHPAEFWEAANIVPLPLKEDIYSVSDRGLQLRLKVIPDKKEDISWGVICCHTQDDFTGPLAIPLIRKGEAENVFFRHPTKAPKRIKNDVINFHTPPRQSRPQVNQLTAQELEAINAVRGPGGRLAGPVLLVRHPEAISNPAKDPVKTIFIPKNTGDKQFRYEHFMLSRWPSDSTLVLAFPENRWSDLSDTMQFRDVADLDRCGAFLFEYEPSKSLFAVAFGLDDHSKPWVALASISHRSAKEPGGYEARLEEEIRMLREETASRHDELELDERRAEVRASISKASVMERPVVKIEVKIVVRLGGRLRLPSALASLARKV